MIALGFARLPQFNLPASVPLPSAGTGLAALVFRSIGPYYIEPRVLEITHHLYGHCRDANSGSVDTPNGGSGNRAATFATAYL